MERIFEPSMKQKVYEVFDGKEKWTIRETPAMTPRFRIDIWNGGWIGFDTLDECVEDIRKKCKPPFVELTLEDFRVAAVPDTNVVYINNETGVGFIFLCAELKFASMGTRYNSAAEVIAAINERRREEYDANR